MPENNQASDATKPEATDSSSTQPGSQAVDMNHTNAIVPHQISNHDKLVQTMVMVDGEWVNVNDTNDQANMKDDMNKVNKKVVEAQKGIVEAKSAADSAAKAADSAVSASVVNSDAITAQSAAISEAKSAISSATAAIQQTAATAASDAAKIRADVAQVQNEVNTAKAANSASVEALKSDVSAAKQDLADVHDRLDQAQSAIEQNQKLINDSVAKITSDVSSTKQDLATVHDSLTKAQSDIAANQKSINDNVAQINADITQDRKDIASAQQANANTAKQLDTYSKQAATQGKTIKSIQDKQDSFTATLADVQGNVSQVSDKVSGLSANLKGAQDNVASVKAQADQLSATLTDHAKSIATLTASAKELSSTLEDADGRLNKVEQTAQTNSSTLSDVQGNLSQVKQQADGLVSTLKDAQGNISTLQQKTDSVSAQLATAQGDIATLQTGVDSVKATLTSHDKSIHTLQADSKSLKDSMVNAQGDISTLRKTATDVTSELEDHTGRLSKVEQSAAKQATTLSDLQGNLSQVEQKADSNTATISSINKNAMQDRGVITDTKTSFDSLTQLGTYSIKASGLSKMPEQHYGTLVVSGSAGSGWLSQQFVADTTGNVYTRVFSNNAWSAWKQGGSQDAINQVKQTADSNSATIRNVQGDVSTLKQTATGVEAALADHEGDIHTLQADSKTLKDDMQDAQGDISTLKKTSTDVTAELQDHAGRISKTEQTASTLVNEFADQQGHLNRVEQTAQGTQQTVANQQGQINNIKTDVSGVHQTITGQGNQIATINTSLNGLNTKYESVSGDLGKLKDQVTTNSTQITQNKKEIDLKADQSTMDNLSGEVSQNKAQLKVQAGQISSKVSSSEYQTLKDKVNGLRIGGVNLIRNSETDIVIESKTTDPYPAWDNKAIYWGLTPGETYTFSVSATNTNGVKEASMRIWNSTVNKEVGNANFCFPADGKRHSKTFTVPNDGVSYDVWLYAGHMGNPEGKNFVTTYHHPQLEVGNVESDYSPNPDGMIASIKKNSTAIDQTNKQISLKADQTEVDQIKNTASQNSSRLDVMAGQISSKVTSTDVNNIVDKKGYATTSTVQSLITQKAGTINESITSLDLKHNATVTQVQSLTASIDGLQSTVANKADKSQITQLSNVIQSKVSSTDFNNLRKAVDLQTLESADANNLKTNGHYFVHNLANNPIPGWVYVDVTGNNNDRIRQDVYQDNGNKHKYRRWVGNSWTDWSQSATESEITQLRDDINLRVKSGDLLSQINIQAGHTLIQSNKIYFDADSFVMSPNSKAFIPAALITNLTADQITTGTLKSIQIDNGDGKFTVNSNGDVVANSIKLRNGQFLQGTIAGSTIYALNNDGVQDPKLAPKSDWYKITPNMIRWFNHYDQSVGQIGVGQGVVTEGNSGFTGTPGLTISDSAKILLGTAQRTVVTGDEIGNLETTGLDWMSRTNLDITVDRLQVNLDPDQGNEYDGKGAQFNIQKDNKIGACFGSGDHGDGLSITTTGGITFNAGFFDVWGEVHIPNNGLTVKDLHVTHWLGVDGSKNSIVNTSQGTVAINAYETAEYYFGDIGEDQTNGDGKVWVSIDYLFGQTVNTSVPYQVFVTPYSSAHVWVSKRLKNRFLVESDKPSASFAWEIKAKRKGYEHTRLKNVDNMMEKPAGVK